MDQRRVPDGWAGWLLTLAAAAPLVVAARLAWTVMHGAADEFFSQDPPSTGIALVGDRWADLWLGGIAPVPLLLVTGLLPLLALCALVLAGRPRALVPGARARLAAVLVAGLATLLGVVGVLGFLAQLLGLLPVPPWFGVTNSTVDDYASPAAILLSTAVLGIVATVVLWPRRDEAQDVELQDAELQDAELHEDHGGTRAGEGAAATPAAATPAGTADGGTVVEQPRPAPTPVRSATVPVREPAAAQRFPVPADPGLYRRP